MDNATRQLIDRIFYKVDDLPPESTEQEQSATFIRIKILIDEWLAAR